MARPIQALTMIGAALLAFAGGACSSDDDKSAATTTMAPVALPSAFADRTDVVRYYTDLGTAPEIAECFAEVLSEVGVADPASLEADQELSETVAARFEVCTASNGASSTES